MLLQNLQILWESGANKKSENTMVLNGRRSAKNHQCRRIVSFCSFQTFCIRRFQVQWMRCIEVIERHRERMATESDHK